MAKRIDETDVSPVIAHKIAARASGADEAIVVGTRAGVIEWANAAWSTVTGYPVDEAISKPIGWLLEAAEIEPDVVDFVQRHFLAGSRCEVEFPVETPDGRSLWIHLDVEPFTDSLGEISDFVAVATDITTRRAGEIALDHRINEALSQNEAGASNMEPKATRRAETEAEISGLETRLALARIADASARADGSNDRHVLAEVTALASIALEIAARPDRLPDLVDIGSRTTSTCAEKSGKIATTLRLDLECGAAVPRVMIEPGGFDTLIADILDSAIAAIGSEWGTVSITTGVAEPGVALASYVDPTLDRFPLTCERPHAFIEIHDTALAPSREELREIETRSGAALSSTRGLELCLAAARAERLGGALRVHGVAGLGTRVILYLPIG